MTTTAQIAAIQQLSGKYVAPAPPRLRTMYDSTSGYDIPVSAELVAGYIDGLYAWSQAEWDRFPNAGKITISIWGPWNTGDCLDIETGDATPAQARPWALARIAAGLKYPILYCSLSVFPTVQASCADLPVQYWIAHYTQIPHLPDGADACQYADDPAVTGGHYDLSICSPSFHRPA